MNEIKDFSLTFTDPHWLGEGAQAREDLCLHGTVHLELRGTVIEYGATVSATALFLLRSLREDRHTPCHENALFPCCGFFMIPQNGGEDVYVIGCDNGIDLEITHQAENVMITLPGVKSAHALVPYADYRRAVLAFVEGVEAIYASSEPKVIEEAEREGALAFRREWERRKGEALRCEGRPRIVRDSLIFRGKHGQKVELYDFFTSLQDDEERSCQPLVKVDASPFYVRDQQVDLSLKALEQFQSELEECYETLMGTAALRHPYEPGFLLKVEMTKYGNAVIEVQIRPIPAQYNPLMIEMECDQSYFPEIFEPLEAIIERMKG